jgi:hypothetical protein
LATLDAGARRAHRHQCSMGKWLTLIVEVGQESGPVKTKCGFGAGSQETMSAHGDEPLISTSTRILNEPNEI